MAEIPKRQCSQRYYDRTTEKDTVQCGRAAEYICDVCSAEVCQQGVILAVQSAGTPTVDLCTACHRRMLDFMEDAKRAFLVQNIQVLS